MNILSLCDFTGNMVRPWLEAGHTATIVDIQHRGVTVEKGVTNGGTLIKVQENILRYCPPWGIDIVFAFPPCTDLANSGARWFKTKGMRRLIDALQLVERCRELCDTIGAPYMIENPVGQLSTYWRKPDYTFDPCDYGDPYTKKTCLWTGNGFVMPPKERVEPVGGSKMHLLPETANRPNLRSATPMGFARAVFEANVR
jgi:hypothetical protein